MFHFTEYRIPDHTAVRFTSGTVMVVTSVGDACPRTEHECQVAYIACARYYARSRRRETSKCRLLPNQLAGFQTWFARGGITSLGLPNGLLAG